MSVTGRSLEVWEDLERIAVDIGLALIADRAELGETIFECGFHWRSPLVSRRMSRLLRDELMAAAPEGVDALTLEVMDEFIHFLVWHGPWQGFKARLLAGHRLIREARA